MLDFVAETAREAGLEDYRVIVNVGRGRRPDRLPPPLAYSGRHADPGGIRMSLIAEIEDEIKESMRARDQLRTDTLRLTLAVPPRRRRRSSAGR